MSQSKFEVQEAVQARHKQAGYFCEHIDQNGNRCPERSVQVAHRIKKGKQGRAAIKPLWFGMTGELLTIWGNRMNKIIHHPVNTRATCIKHNSAVLVGMSDIKQHKEILMDIWEDLK